MIGLADFKGMYRTMSIDNGNSNWLTCVAKLTSINVIPDVSYEVGNYLGSEYCSCRDHVSGFRMFWTYMIGVGYNADLMWRSECV